MPQEKNGSPTQRTSGRSDHVKARKVRNKRLGTRRGRSRDAGWKKVCGGPTGPFEDFEVIRVEVGMSTTRFGQMIDMPERIWRRWQAQTGAGRQAKGPGRVLPEMRLRS